MSIMFNPVILYVRTSIGRESRLHRIDMIIRIPAGEKHLLAQGSFGVRRLFGVRRPGAALWYSKVRFLR